MAAHPQKSIILGRLDGSLCANHLEHGEIHKDALRRSIFPIATESLQDFGEYQEFPRRPFVNNA
jgi:hypothetical protein